MTTTNIARDVVGTGSCLHGGAVAWLDREVVFDEPCAECARLLRTEGYMVVEPSPNVTADAA